MTDRSAPTAYQAFRGLPKNLWMPCQAAIMRVVELADGRRLLTFTLAAVTTAAANREPSDPSAEFADAEEPEVRR